MCELTDKGYLMTDGTLIPFHNLKIEMLKPQHVKELADAKASVWDTLLIRESLHSTRNALQSVVTTQGLISENLDKLAMQLNETVKSIDSIPSQHALGCPLNKDGIISLIDNHRIEQREKFFANLTKWSKRFSIITAAIAVAYGVLQGVMFIIDYFRHLINRGG